MQWTVTTIFVPGATVWHHALSLTTVAFLLCAGLPAGQTLGRRDGEAAGRWAGHLGILTVVGVALGIPARAWPSLGSTTANIVVVALAPLLIGTLVGHLSMRRRPDAHTP